MAARMNRLHQDAIRAKIQADRLVELLHAFVFKEKFAGGRIPTIDSTRLRAIQTLLNKSLPDLHHNQHSGALVNVPISPEKLAAMSDSELDQIIGVLERLGIDPSKLQAEAVVPQ